MLTQEQIKQILEYNPLTGDFIWLKSTGKAKRGNIAGGIKADGYRRIGIDGKSYAAHRLAYVYMVGPLPAQELDHKDVNRSNNAWDNLRLCSRAENQHNKSIGKNNSSGMKGVTFSKNRRKWKAEIGLNNDRIFLGYYDDPELADLVVTEARDKYHKQFSRSV